MELKTIFSKQKTNSKEKTILPERKSFVDKYRLKYIKLIEDQVFKESETTIYNRLKYISVTASESNPAENITKYILRSFALYLLSPVFIIFAVIIGIMGIVFGVPLVIIFSVVLAGIGAFELLQPYKFFRFLVTTDFRNFENGLYNSRFELIRIMYNNFIMYGNSLYIDERVKLNKYIYTYFKYLEYQEGVSYDKIINSALFFTNLEFEKFLKDIGTYMRDQNIVQFYQKKEDELKTQENAVMSERATAFASISTLLMFGTGIIGLFLGMGITIQPIMLQIYNIIMKNFNAGMATQISSELSIFNLIRSLPPLYYFYVFLFMFAIVSATILYKLSNRVVGV